MTDFQTKEMQMFDEQFRIISHGEDAGFYIKIGNGICVSGEIDHLKSFILAHDARLLDMVIGMAEKMKVQIPDIITIYTDRDLADSIGRNKKIGFNAALSSLITELKGYKKQI